MACFVWDIPNKQPKMWQQAFRAVGEDFLSKAVNSELKKGNKCHPSNEQIGESTLNINSKLRDCLLGILFKDAADGPRRVHSWWSFDCSPGASKLETCIFEWPHF